MKSIILSMVAASAIALSAPVYASDPCASVLCLYGKAIGSGGGSECKSAEKAPAAISKIMSKFGRSWG